jgi:hypothetical protein
MRDWKLDVPNPSDFIPHKLMGLRLRGGRHVIRDNRVGRIGAGIRGIPDRYHDERHDRDNQGCPHDEFDHFRTASITVKAAQEMQGVSPPFSKFSIFNF